MQDQLRELLGIIDDNSEHLPNGDYLNAMNLLNNLYNQAARRAPRAPVVIHRTVDPSSILQNNIRLLRARINEYVNQFGTDLVEQLRAPPVAGFYSDSDSESESDPVPPVPPVPDRRGLDNPNIPRQGGVPHFETREERGVWILQNDKEECSICHRIIARGDSRRHQQRQICEQTRARHGF